MWGFPQTPIISKSKKLKIPKLPKPKNTKVPKSQIAQNQKIQRMPKSRDRKLPKSPNPQNPTIPNLHNTLPQKEAATSTPREGVGAVFSVCALERPRWISQQRKTTRLFRIREDLGSFSDQSQFLSSRITSPERTSRGSHHTNRHQPWSSDVIFPV